VREHELTGCEVDGVREHRQLQRRAHRVDVEPETVGDDGHLGAGRPQLGDERLEPGIDRNLARHRAHGCLVAADQGPLPDAALAAPDLATRVLLADHTPFRRTHPLEEVDADVAGRDGAVEIEEHRRSGELEHRRSRYRQHVTRAGNPAR
jgi:hypothetical protein